MLKREKRNKKKFQWKGKIVLFGTNNIGKFNEVRNILTELKISVGMLRIKASEIQSLSLKEIARESALEAFKRCCLPLIVEDAGLFVDALKAFPGPYSAYVYKTISNPGIPSHQHTSGSGIKRMQLAIVTFLLMSLSLILSCKEEPHKLTANIYDNNLPGVVKDTTLYAIQDTFYFKTSKINTQFSLRLGLGSINGIEARPILRFTNFDVLPNIIQVDSAWIKIFGNGSQAGASTNPIASRLHPVRNVWVSNIDSVWSNYSDNIDNTILLGQLDIAPDDSNNYTYELTQEGIDLVNIWTDTSTATEENYGFIIDFDNADFIQYFSAINSGADPQLIVRYTVPDDTTVYRDTLSATFDAYLYQGDFSRIDDRNYVSSLIVHSTLLDFGLDDFLASIPEEAVPDISILSANIELPVDLNNSLLDPTYNLSNYVTLNLTSELSDPDVVVDSTSGFFAATREWASDSSFIQIASDANRKTLASMIRQQLFNQDQFKGFVISLIDNASDISNRIGNEKEQFSYLALYTFRESDLKKRARLIIKYWEPASPRL